MFMQIQRYIPRGSVMLMILTFGSYALGLVRDRTFARTYGASASLDAYNAAFLMPDFLFNLLVASGIAAAVVPLFTQLKQKNKEEAQQYTSSVLTASVVVMLAVAAVLWFFAEPASHLVAPGLSVEAKMQVAKLMRILALSPLLFAASNTLGAILVAEKRFFFYGLSPIFYNIGIIGGTILLAPKFGIVGTALGTLIGAGLHLLVRIIDISLAGWKLRLSFDWKTEAFKKTIRLMLPKMFGHPVELATFWIFTSLASLLAAGSISVLNFARNFQSVPVSIIGITLATTAFPHLASAATAKSRMEFSGVFWRTFGAAAAGSLAAAAVLYAASQLLVSRLLGGGNFGADDIQRTALTLGVFCLSVPTESLSHLAARAFYATQNTLTPVILSVVSLVISGAGAYLLLPSLGIIALPLGFFVGSVVKLVGLLVLLPRQVKKI